MIWQCTRLWCFRSVENLFVPYIKHWMAIKEAASRAGDGPSKATAKRFLNSLYGKFGQQVYRTACVPYMGDKGELKFAKVETDDGNSYLPIAMFIAAYARRRIVTEADALGDHFVYADTDSLHVIGDRTVRPKDIHPTRLGAFKLESMSLRARYIGPKKYVHYYEWEAGKKGRAHPFEVKCAGLPDAAKEHVTYDNFHSGAEYKGKLAGMQVKGGYLLKETVYTVRVRTWDWTRTDIGALGSSSDTTAVTT